MSWVLGCLALYWLDRLMNWSLEWLESEEDEKTPNPFRMARFKAGEPPDLED